MKKKKKRPRNVFVIAMLLNCKGKIIKSKRNKKIAKEFLKEMKELHG